MYTVAATLHVGASSHTVNAKTCVPLALVSVVASPIAVVEKVFDVNVFHGIEKINDLWLRLRSWNWYRQGSASVVRT